MKLTTFDQVQPAFISEYRDKVLKISLDKFWGAVGVAPVRGHRYETGVTKLPDTVKRLVFIQYGAGIPTDCASPEFMDFVATLRNSNPKKSAKAVKLIREAQALLIGDEL